MTDHDPIAVALAEDINTGDLTSTFFVAPAVRASANIVAKQSAVVAGVAIAGEVFRRVDASLEVEVLAPDGAQLSPGQNALRVHGLAKSILTAERVALNFLQQLSGVATLTREFVRAIDGTRAKILDTRKTTPGLRTLEKSAVAAGGGVNHRFGLYDMVMVKDNHLAANPTGTLLQEQILKFKSEHPDIRVELEADTLEQVETFLRLTGVDVILLDNMNLEQLRAAVAKRGSLPVILEASGGVNLQTVRGIAETGVDFISVGALTHSAPAVDFSLDLQLEPVAL